MRFRYSNITPPSRHQRPASSLKDTPLTGFTVYSNPVSEAIDRDDFVTPSRTRTYYSDDEVDVEDVDGVGTNGGHTGTTRSRASMGAETAQKLARQVLPHLGSSEIAYLVEYNLKEKEREQAAAAMEPRQQLQRQQAAQHIEANAVTKTIKTKTSTFMRRRPGCRRRRWLFDRGGAGPTGWVRWHPVRGTAAQRSGENRRQIERATPERASHFVFDRHGRVSGGGNRDSRPDRRWPPHHRTDASMRPARARVISYSPIVA